MSRFRFVGWSLLALAGCWLAVPTVRACPFCSAVSQTLSEEMDSMDAAVIARLAKVPPPAKDPAARQEDVPKAEFEILQALKGGDVLKGKTVETVYFGDGKVGDVFLIMAVDPPNLLWSTPLRLSDRAQKYLVELPRLPKQGGDRLAFFQNYLEDSDELLARDAYDEFAKAPYPMVKELKDRMQHEQLVKWIGDPDLPASRRRLYLVMLGVCGSTDDLPMLEAMLRSSDKKARSGLDALIACYLTLAGPEGMPLVEDVFLKNKQSEYADTYAAIMALRFHGTEGGVIDRERLLVGLRHMLDRPELADLVIPDLARWEDWSQVEKLAELFKRADEKTSWVRVPVINYLRACPLPEAKARIQELEKIDPAAVKRANTFFPLGGGTSSTGKAPDPQDGKIAPKTK